MTSNAEVLKMPELPEVETIKRDLEKFLCAKRISKVTILDRRVVKHKSVAEFRQLLENQTISAVSRRGKAVIFQLSNGFHWVVQPMMTGQLVFHPAKEVFQTLKETKIIFEFTTGELLAYNDQRLFGRHLVVRDLSEISYFKLIGPEPFTQDFTVAWMKTALRKKTIAIKNSLMDHRVVAGVGNIYASEILFNSRISPRRKSSSLTAKEVGGLIDATRQVLQEAIDLRGCSMRNYRDGLGQKGEFNTRVKVYGRDAQACVRCRLPITRIVQAGRSTFYCKKCQH